VSGVRGAVRQCQAAESKINHPLSEKGCGGLPALRSHHGNAVGVPTLKPWGCETKAAQHRVQALRQE